MHFGFALKFSDLDLWNIDLLDIHLDLLDTDIASECFVCLHNVFKTSSTHVFKTTSRHTFKTFSRHVFKMSSRHVFKTSWRRLQHNNFASSDTSWRPIQNIFKTSCKMSSRCLGRRKVVTLETCWRSLQKFAVQINCLVSAWRQHW